MTKIEELQKELDDLKEQEYKEMISKHYPEFKAMEGKFSVIW